MMTRITTLLLAALLTLAFAPSSFVEAQAPAAKATDAPTKTHALRLKGLDGKTYDVAEMRGEVVMVSFGATWCAPCAWELFAIEELKQEYKEKPVRFFWVSIEDKETSNALIRDFAKTYRVTIPVLRDPAKEVFSQFTDRVRIPLVVFFDREGRFVAPAHRGMSSEMIQYKQMIRGRLNTLLAAPAQTNASGAKKETR
jgi:thiol-disulfide isomerase/thioredoxin